MTDDPGRPDPDRLLRRVNDEAERARRAKLKIFFGFAPGVGKTYAMLESATKEEWSEVLAANVVGASLVTAAALGALRRSQGRALYISSYSVRMPLPGLGLYRVSKVALDALIECWRMEHPDVDYYRGQTVSVSGEEFYCSADGEVYGPERKRTWHVEPAAYRFVFPR